MAKESAGLSPILLCDALFSVPLRQDVFTISTTQHFKLTTQVSFQKYINSAPNSQLTACSSQEEKCATMCHWWIHCCSGYLQNGMMNRITTMQRFTQWKVISQILDWKNRTQQLCPKGLPLPLLYGPRNQIPWLLLLFFFFSINYLAGAYLLRNF